ncbi:ARM repeat-containing protein [Rhizodiscina lignyota]|uniref:ARM repeat-containing protein n=1 Tax=Rhizodiscina lignyota TaxID=1504668 RepID=A0A9P4I9V9_9PEZI|nr:ARM repeat-containing protein [Rhizodiscina lignyota]
MQSLKSARFLEVMKEIAYPEGIKSPNPSLNVGGRGKGRQYDKDFLLQFQEVFKEKPSVDWDSKVKETVGDGSTDSARPQSARTPAGMSRQASRGGLSGMGGPAQMGSFGAGPQGRTLPPGTTSSDRFRMSMQGPPQGMPQGLGSFGRPGAGFPQPPMMARNPSASGFQPARGLDSPRTGSSRGGRGSKKANPREEHERQAKMPLTAGQDLKPLEQSHSGWKASSLGAVSGPAPLPGGRMPPDMVQRKVKSALNKMTPEKFDKIADDILAIAGQSREETDGRTLRQVIQLTFEKACDEAHWASMYAKFCKRMLETMSTEIKDENVKDKHGNPVVGGALFRKYLLNRCQEEFERGWEVDLPDKPEGQSEGAVMLSDEYYIAAAAKRRGLGLIQFIGELFKLQMLTARIMHECVLKLLNFEGLPDESAIESLVKLLRTIGATMEATDNGKGKSMMDMYFDRISKTMAMQGLPSRLTFMLMDISDLRAHHWRSKDDAKGPKTIQEIHQEAAAAQQAQEMERARNAQRPRQPTGRGDARSFSGGGHMPPPDYPRNQVNMADLKNLTRGSSRNVSSGPSNFGPSSLLSGSRSNSGRKGLGPGSARAGEDSGMSSRTGTPPAKEKESSTSMNTFSALAGLDASGEGADDVASPPSNASSPPAVKSTPAGADARARSKSPAVGDGKKDGTDGAGEP